MTIVNDKFDYAPYIPDNTGKCISKNVGESVIKTFYIPERPSTTPSVSPISSEFPSMSSDVEQMTLIGMTVKSEGLVSGH